MTARPLLTLLSVALFSSSYAIAQQPVPPAPDTPPTAGTAAPAPPRPRGPQQNGSQQGSTQRNVREIRIVRNEGGMGVGGHSRIVPPGMWWKNPETIQKLTLTPAQQAKMDDIFQKSRIQLIDLKANVEKQEVTLEPMLDANPPDTNKVLGQIDHLAQARAELEKANARMLLGIRGVLTADQWTKLQTAERGERHMFHGNAGPSGPMGGPAGREGMMGSGGPGGVRDLHFMAPDGPAEAIEKQ